MIHQSRSRYRVDEQRSKSIDAKWKQQFIFWNSHGMSVSILQLLSKQFFIFIKNYRLFIILNVWIVDKNYIFSKEFSNKIAKSNFSCFLWVDINVTNNCVKWSHDIISYWSQAPVTTHKHIVTDFVISANIVSLIKESIWYRIVMKLSIFTHVSHKDYTANSLVSDVVSLNAHQNP